MQLLGRDATEERTVLGGVGHLEVSGLVLARLWGGAASGDDTEALAEAAFGGARDWGEPEPVDGGEGLGPAIAVAPFAAAVGLGGGVIVGGGRALDGSGEGAGKDAAAEGRHVKDGRAGGVEEVVAVAAVAEILGAECQQLRGQGVQRAWAAAGQARRVVQARDGALELGRALRRRARVVLGAATYRHNQRRGRLRARQLLPCALG